jgi:hypothetical protein
VDNRVQTVLVLLYMLMNSAEVSRVYVLRQHMYTVLSTEVHPYTSHVLCAKEGAASETSLIVMGLVFVEIVGQSKIIVFWTEAGFAPYCIQNEVISLST